MNCQLSAIVDDLQAVERRLRQLRARLPQDAWCQAPVPGSWSPSECVDHLALTSRTALPLLWNGLRAAARHAEPSPSTYRRDVVGWLVWKLMDPTRGFWTRTVPAWEPDPTRAPDAVMDDFVALQADLIACVRAADRLPLDRVTLQSPFDGRVSYNLYAALTLIPRHQLRHVAQAERAAGVSVAARSALAG